MGPHQLLLVANGAGGMRAAAAVEAGLAEFDAEGIVSTGFCGGLTEGLDVADMVVGTSVTDGAQNFAAIAPECARPHRKGVIRSIGHVVRTAAEKRRLHAAGGDAVEMEAATVAGKAAGRGLPFYCIRVVTDVAGEDMANDFNRALRADGHFDTMVILRSTLRAPLVLLPELIRLRNRCARSARVLGEFIADCRF
jgi:nucleoside phosphorylase